MGRRTGVSSFAGGSHVSSLGTRGSLTSANTGAGAGNKGLNRTGSTVGTTSVSTRSRTSRLLAPTASSLARAQDNGTRLLPSTEQAPSRKSPGLSSVFGGQLSGSSKSVLTQIMNSPTPSNTQSPRGGGVFSQPLSPPAKNQNPSLGAAAATLNQKRPVPVKPKVLPGHKPRISRSKVIAKLASQRAASGSSTGNGKTRSSMGTGKRQSLGGAKIGRGNAVGDNVLMSAKKRVRQSEYARRRSRSIPGHHGPSSSKAMDVDDQ